MEKIVFGPVPSRRFGRSLGINNIPYPKKCTYCCIYCQIGKTIDFRIEREKFYSPEEIEKQVEEVINNLKEKRIDYISFVPDGEPTLDINLGHSINRLKKFGIKIAVITNSSLIWRKDVREDLKNADTVSLKIDCMSEDVWKKINRPLKNLNLNEILDGIRIFSREFKGELLTETLFIKNINDTEEEIEKIGEFLKEICPTIAYIGYPTRPPTEKWIEIPDKKRIDFVYIVFKNKKINVKIIEKKEGEFGYTGDLIKDILSIVSVHPMSRREMEKFITENKGHIEIINNLIEEGKIEEIEYRKEKYYRRKF